MKAGYLRNFLFATLFISAISLPGLTMLLSQKAQIDSPASFYTDTLTVKNFPSSFNSYFNNSFSFRKQLIKAFFSFRVFVLRETFIDDKVIVGSDGWLFYATDSDGYGIADFTGKIHLSQHQLHQIANNLETQHRWLKNRGVQYLVVICPNKQTIYPEYLPLSIQKGKSVLDQIVEYLGENSTIPLLDLRPVLLEQKKKNKSLLYFKTDTHWNSLGAFYGYKSIFEKIDKNNAPEVADYSLKTNPCLGRDIAKMLGLETFFRDEEHKLILKKTTRPAFTSKPRAVIFQDSYFIALKPFFTPYFDTIISRPHFWNSFDYRLIEETKPDIVIYQMVERYSSLMLRDNPVSIK